jgi:hypothetical protein
MADFSQLDPETRAFAMVGQFLQKWAEVEAGLHECIQTAFKLTPTMTHIICANLRLHDKLHILRTVVDVSDINPKGRAFRFDKLLRRVNKYSSYRNTLAHCPFHYDKETNGVHFVSIKAKGKYETAPIILTDRRIYEIGRVVEALKTQLNLLNKVLNISQIKDEEYLASIVRRTMPAGLPWEPIYDVSPMMRRTMSPALLYCMSEPTPLPLDADSTNQEKSPQTPDNIEE